jgi:hypothetical protein
MTQHGVLELYVTTEPRTVHIKWWRKFDRQGVQLNCREYVNPLKTNLHDIHHPEINIKPEWHCTSFSMDAGTLHFNFHIEDKFIHKLFYLKRWSAEPVKLLTFISEVPMSNLSWDTLLVVFRVSSVPSGKCQASTYNWASTSSFHIHSSSWFTELCQSIPDPGWCSRCPTEHSRWLWGPPGFLFNGCQGFLPQG